MDNKDILLGDDFVVTIPQFAELDDDNKFILENVDEEVISDKEFSDLLVKLGITESGNDSNNDSNKDPFIEEKEQFEMEKELAREKIKIEFELLSIAKEKFEREKNSWETLKKISEASLKAEKDEFEAYKEREMKKIYLESQKLVDGCKNFKDLFEKYNSQ